MKRRIRSVIVTMMIVSCMCCSSIIKIDAKETTNQQVDGSYLTVQESSTANIAQNSLLRGKHLMDGTVTISKSGVKKIFVYGSTTADHTVDHITVIVYVEEYNPEKDAWSQVDCWSAEKENDYYVVTQRMIEVEGGHYYRARCDHFAWNVGETLVDESVTVTDGIWVD